MGNSQIKTWWSDLPDDELRESAWERQMNLSGIEVFERSKYNAKGKMKAASEMSAGQKLIREYLTRAEAAIKEVQKKAIHNPRLDRALKATLCILPTDTLALLTLKAMFDKTMSAKEPTEGYNLQSASVQLSRVVEQELNFLNWLEKSKEAAQAYADEKGLRSTPKSMAERLIEEEGFSGRSLRRWKHSFDELSEYEWTVQELHYCGEALIGAVAAELSEVFQVHLTMRRGVSQKTIRMHADMFDRFLDIESKVASMQVIKKPMLSKPRRWVAI